MLTFYLSTVVIWMIIIYCIIFLFKDNIKARAAALTTTETKKGNIFSRFGMLFVLSAIPVFRLLIAIALIYIATCSQEDFNKLMNKNKDEDNHEG